uniref:Uncharacterized protein n=1 Tax=Panagrolaimus sp. PS1159 TaxID=55785 RepID=A0AC35GRD0_9BILA
MDFHTSNSFTKCSTCLTLRLGLHQNRFSPDCVVSAKQFLKQHLENIKLEKQDYYVRMQHSRTSNDLLSIAHDQMSKEKTKFPHLLEDRSKKITDTMKIMNSLCLGVVHKIPQNSLGRDQLHAYWNIDQMSGGTSNTIISQLFNIISNTNPIPPEISIQLDNCAANKNYNTLASFGLLLLWVPNIKKIYICMPEVGHTHDDVDRHFGILASKLRKKQIYSPFGYHRFFDETFPNVVTNNLLPTTYDFLSITDSIVNKFKEVNSNHLFELSRNADGEVIVRIGRYVRSESFLSHGRTHDSHFMLFKDKPDLAKLPPIIPRNELNKKGFDDLCNEMKTLMPSSDFLELQNLPDFITATETSEDFQQLLDRISSQMVTENSTIQRPEFTNIGVEDFLKNPKIWRTWQPPTEAEIEDFASELQELALDAQDAEQISENLPTRPKQVRKKKGLQNSANVQSGTEPPQKRPRGRPKKT